MIVVIILIAVVLGIAIGSRIEWHEEHEHVFDIPLTWTHHKGTYYGETASQDTVTKLGCVCGEEKYRYDPSEQK